MIETMTAPPTINGKMFGCPYPQSIEPCLVRPNGRPAIRGARCALQVFVSHSRDLPGISLYSLRRIIVSAVIWPSNTLMPRSLEVLDRAIPAGKQRLLAP